ncbi:MAG TPA: hypothetical protein PKH65_09560 [Bacteroidia bacterium]|nr:hypothetical protein [Bacteroidia bacterium]HNT80914.1 hypothetical protein [Bacteroidia bacterium]
MKSLRCQILLIALCIWSLLSPGNSMAQNAVATLQADTHALLIGQQVRMQLLLNVPAEANVQWPLLPDSIHKLELLNKSNIDTLREDQRNQYVQSFYITSFDSGTHTIEPITFYYSLANNLDSVKTDFLSIQVHTVEVDTSEAIRDIKSIEEVPFSFKDLIPHLLISISILLIVFLIWYLRKRWKKKTLQPEEKQLKIPPHELALQQLAQLKSESLWQQGRNKEYHSRLTEIVRLFIENKWQVPALEQTSFEILHEIERKQICHEENFKRLKYMLEIADGVKFAKAIPVAYENEQSFQFAEEFVRYYAAETLTDKGGETHV